MFSATLTNVVRAALFSVCTLSSLTACRSDGTTTAPLPTVSQLVAKTDSARLVAPVGTTISGTQVQVLDQDGNPMSGVLVSFTVFNGGHVSLASTRSDTNGLATVDWTLGTIAGADSLEATVGANIALYMVATAQAGPVAQLIAVSGDQQVVAEGATEQLVVKAVDQYGNVVANASVTWIDEGGGTLSATSSTTDANGLAQVTLTADRAPEQYTVLAQSAAATVTFVDTSN